MTSIVVLYMGGPVWGMCWCPGGDENAPQYLAVSTHLTSDTMTHMYSENRSGLLQVHREEMVVQTLNAQGFFMF